MSMLQKVSITAKLQYVFPCSFIQPEHTYCTAYSKAGDTDPHRQHGRYKNDKHFGKDIASQVAADHQISGIIIFPIPSFADKNKIKTIPETEK